MVTKRDVSGIIKSLEGDKGSPAISIVLPTYSLPESRAQNPRLIQKAVSRAKALITSRVKENDTVARLHSALDDLVAQVDFLHLQEGLALYVSPTLSLKVLLPFQVKEKILLGNSFEIRDLYYYHQYINEYFILLLTRKAARLFKACANQFEEIKNEGFPMTFVDDYEYASPSRASSMRHSLQSFERDKSQLNQIREIHFIKELDNRLERVTRKKSPLIISGAIKQLALFKLNSSLANLIEGEVTGNYSKNIEKLKVQAWDKVRLYQTSHEQIWRLAKIPEEIGTHNAVTGIRDVWHALLHSKAKTLFIEKDFASPAYLSSEDHQLYLKPPKLKYERVPDIVANTIEIARQKGVKIYFFENDKLKAFDRIVLFQRFRN